MTVSVIELDGWHRALIPGTDTVLRCCEAGHENAEEAARHAWRLVTALERHEAQAA